MRIKLCKVTFVTISWRNCAAEKFLYNAICIPRISKISEFVSELKHVYGLLNIKIYPGETAFDSDC